MSRATKEPMTPLTERGDWMQLASGRRFYPVDPRPDEVHIDDIAHALSLVNRFGGQTRAAYSVAQHSVLVSRICPAEDALAGLLHDATEAYIGDIIRPLKRTGRLDGYLAIEERLGAAIAARFGIPAAMSEPVRRADNILLVTEARDLFDHLDPEWESKLADLPRLPARITPWEPDEAERTFLEAFVMLAGEYARP